MTQAIDQNLIQYHEPSFFKAFENLKLCVQQLKRVTTSQQIYIHEKFYQYLENNNHINVDNNIIITNNYHISEKNYYKEETLKDIWMISKFKHKPNWTSSRDSLELFTNDSWKIITMDKIGSELIFKKENGDIGIFDFKNNKSYVIKKGIKRENMNLKRFFRGYDISQLLGAEKYNKVIDFIFWYHNNIRNIGTIIERIIQNPEIEKFVLLEGLNINVSLSDTDSYRPYYNKDNKKNLYIILKRFKHYKDFINILIKAKQPLTDTILDNITSSSTSRYGKNCKDEINHYKKAFKLLQKNDDFSLTYYYDLASNEYYKDLTGIYHYSHDRLMERANYYQIFEGLDPDETLSTLRDYAMMQTRMLAEGRKYNKYPDHLLSRHKIVQKNYNQHKEIYDEIGFERIINQYKHFEFKDKNYSTVLPKTTQDIKDEGSQLKHCVSSYIRLIYDNKSIVLFVRENKELDIPFVTLDIQKGKITQARGLQNKMADSDVKLFLEKFAKKKDLEITAWE
jgi:hypothetical protein